MANFQHKCCECDKVFTTSSNLNRHVRIKHKVDSNTTMGCYSEIICPLCDKACISKKSLEKHIVEDHEIEIEKETLEFSKKDEFSIWKVRLEMKNRVLFVKNRGTKIVSNARINYYYCHRSGRYSRKGVGMRNLKIIGTNKINSFCPATIKVTEKNNKFFVEYTKTHVGHTKDLGRLRILLN